MATYYVRADGTAADKEAATSDSAASTAMDITTFDAEKSSFAIDDVIVISDEGGTYAGDTLDLDGLSDLTLEANSGGTPLFTGTDQIASLELSHRITLDGISFEKTSGYAYALVRAMNPGDDCVIKNCTIDGADDSGLAIGDYGASSMTRDTSGWIIEDNTFKNNGVCGMNCVTGLSGYGLTDFIIRRNTAYLNCTSNGNYGGGLKHYGHEDSIAGFEIYDNYIYNNGPTVKDGNQSDGVGIYMDACLGTSVNPNLIHHNYVWDNNGNGIFIEISEYCHVYANICIDNGDNTNGDNTFLPANIVVDARGEGATPYYSRYNKIYNNSCYGGRCGMKCSSYDEVGSNVHLLNNIFKNNICAGFSEQALCCVNAGTNDTNGSGNVYDNNCFGPDSVSEFIEWEDNSYVSSYSAFATAHGSGWVQVAGDPLYTNPGSRDLTLQSGSPCRDEGDNLGSPFDSGLMSSSTWPDGVVTGDRDDY